MWRLDKVTGNIIRHDYNQFNVHLPLQFALAVPWILMVSTDNYRRLNSIKKVYI